MMFFNFHTHNNTLNGDTSTDEMAILNRRPYDALPCDSPCSVGLHPWDVSDDWAEQVEMVRQKAKEDSVWAIGECGLDRLRGGEMSLQTDAFKAQVAIAREVGKPIIVHCVKAFDELLKCIDCKDTLPSKRTIQETRHTDCATRACQPPIIIHGFRGKPQQAKQIIAKGLLLSFGYHYNVETLRFVYSTNLPFFLETDDLHLSVRQIYEQVAGHLDVDVSRLVRLCDPRQICGRLP